MERLVRIPKNDKEWLEWRSHDLTSTDIAALFGLSPYTTVFELYHRHVNKEYVEEFKGNEFTKWGNRLESAIAQGIAEDEGFVVNPMNEYISIPELRLGASFDFSIDSWPPLGASPSCAPFGGILEIKNVFGLIFNDQWVTEDGIVEAPPHIEIQCQVQMLVSERKFLYIGALVSGNKVELLKRGPEPDIHESILKKVAEFWHMVDNKIEPKPNFIKDADFLARIYNYAEPDKILDARDDTEVLMLAKNYKAAGEQEKVAAKNKKSFKAQLLMKIGDHEKTIGEGFSISAGMIAPTTVEEYDKKGYRNFRVNFKKPKKKKES